MFARRHYLAIRLSAWRPNDAGNALIEAALVFPILFIFFFGVSELCEGFIASRRVEAAAFTAADLVARLQTVNSADLVALKSIIDETIKPLPVATVGLVVTSVIADENNATTVAWSEALGSGVTALHGEHINRPAGRPNAVQHLGHLRASQLYVPIDPFDADRRRRATPSTSVSTTEVCPTGCQDQLIASESERSEHLIDRSDPFLPYFCFARLFGHNKKPPHVRGHEPQHACGKSALKTEANSGSLLKRCGV